MPQIQLKAGYGPTLGQLLAPRWQASPSWMRALGLLIIPVVLALAIGIALTLKRASISYGGPVPFSFEYRDIYRTAPDPGGYVRVLRHKDGSLEDSFSVLPLELPSYQGSVSGELPLFADAYIEALKSRYQDFQLSGEGKTRVNTVPGYQVLYRATIAGREMYGRDVLLLPEKPGVRRGVDIVMLTSPHASSQVKSPSEVASAGPLNTALHTFSFG